ncbi:IS66 family insertion sequence element accessory protein TnpB [Pedobacter alluvionis]|uniref:IS66 family insertion sequence element accessory protein TnpB n=1 Tax=Pedobacter alluvionis TaxID=475253 RepID=A0ABY2HN96_9SPHI|nr:IS66 family insertion sequence element accessory protein TnpB [Pedobacter alluvionis]
MFSLGSPHRFYLYSGHCDMRKSFDRLCGLVSFGMQRNPTSGEVFVFLNRSRTHIKLIGAGLCLLQAEGTRYFSCSKRRRE